MYLDTSVAVKLYTREPDSDEWERLVLGQRLISSELLHAEFNSALLAKERARGLSASQRRQIWTLFENHVHESRIELAELDGTVLREAVQIMTWLHPRCRLRTLDALHLATYAGLEAGPLCTRDDRMRLAAALLGFPLAA
jgi:predicted nucleic acid-binding protein